MGRGAGRRDAEDDHARVTVGWYPSDAQQGNWRVDGLRHAGEPFREISASGNRIDCFGNLGRVLGLHNADEDMPTCGVGQRDDLLEDLVTGVGVRLAALQPRVITSVAAGKLSLELHGQVLRPTDHAADVLHGYEILWLEQQWGCRHCVIEAGLIAAQSRGGR